MLGIPLTVHETSKILVERGKRKVIAEVWIIDDHFWMALSNPEALASMLTKKMAKEIGNGLVKYTDSHFVICIKKSVADFGTDEDIQGIIKHESAHFFLGHAGRQSTPQLEKEVDKQIGPEVEWANHYFALRYLAYVQAKNPDRLKFLPALVEGMEKHDMMKRPFGSPQNF